MGPLGCSPVSPGGMAGLALPRGWLEPGVVICPGEGPVHGWLRPLTRVATVFFLVGTSGGKRKRPSKEPRPVAKLSRPTREDSHPDFHEPGKGAGPNLSGRRLALVGRLLAKGSSTISDGKT